MTSVLISGQPFPRGPVWASFAAACLPAVMGGLSSQVHGLAAPDLDGAFGMSRGEASWITTARFLAEGVAVLAASPLLMAVGPRRLLVAALVATGGLGMVHHAAAGPGTAVPLRFEQAFACGMLLVVMVS